MVNNKLLSLVSNLNNNASFMTYDREKTAYNDRFFVVIIKRPFRTPKIYDRHP